MRWAPMLQREMRSAVALVPQQQQHKPINLVPKPKPAINKNNNVWKIPQSAYDKVKQPDFHLPLTIPLPFAYQAEGSEQPQQHLVLRLLQASDIQSVVELCSNEYGRRREMPCASQLSLPVVLDYLDDLTLRPLVEASLFVKVQHDQSKKIPNDHVVLVLECSSYTEPALRESQRAKMSEIIGMIEVSRQPVIPNRNPPAFPRPLWLKRLIGSYHSVTSPTFNSQQTVSNHLKSEQKMLQGWITNLLVSPHYRSRGCAKLLVTVCETIAKQHWTCSSMHLHCDAHPQRGQSSQALYVKSLNYQTLDQAKQTNFAISNTDNGATQEIQASQLTMANPAPATGNVSSESSLELPPMGPAPLEPAGMSSIFIVQGVPLLYLHKQL
ncbi:hypothetical protein MPSEU_000234400 [Mayamaea pseudoterrestris]|nr:hypothetical protein MPSEU_000234400 [Mayamaea pseudoterrestris]